MEEQSNILSFIPQRAPFVMVDEVISSTENVTTTAFSILPGNIFVEDGLFKEPGLVENIAQTAAASAGFKAKAEGAPVRLGYIGSIRNLEVLQFPKINDRIITEITIENQIFDVSIIKGRVMLNGQLLAHCEMKIFISNQ